MNYRDLFWGDFSKYRSALMGVAMLSIMLSHQRFVHGLPWNVFEAYGHWGVDVFLFLSGMGMVRSLSKYSTGEFYFRRFKRLFPICIFCGVLKYLVFLTIGEPIRNLEVGLHIGFLSVFSLDLWFIYSIAIYYLLSPYLIRVLKSHPWQTLIVVYVLSISMQHFFAEKVGYEWLNPLGVILYTTERLPVFMVGMLTSMYSSQIDKKHFLYSACAFGGAVALSVLLKAHLLVAELFVLVYPLLSVSILAVLSLVISLFLHLPKWGSALFDYVGRHSLEVYLVHEFIFGALLLTSYTKINHLLLLIISFVLSFVVAWACRWCTDKLMMLFPCTR